MDVVMVAQLALGGHMTAFAPQASHDSHKGGFWFKGPGQPDHITSSCRKRPTASHPKHKAWPVSLSLLSHHTAEEAKEHYSGPAASILQIPLQIRLNVECNKKQVCFYQIPVFKEFSRI